MSNSAIQSRFTMKIGKALKQQPILATSVRKAKEILQRIMGPEIAVSWDFEPNQQKRNLVVEVVAPTDGIRLRKNIHPFVVTSDEQLGKLVQELKAVLEYLTAFIRAVDQLLQDMRVWIGKYAPELEIEEQTSTFKQPISGVYPIEIEDHIDSEYTAHKFFVRSQDSVVEIHPFAAWSPGTEGVVDMTGQEQEHTLIFSPKEGGWLWVQEHPKVEMKPLNGKLFSRLLRECLETE